MSLLDQGRIKSLSTKILPSASSDLFSQMTISFNEFTLYKAGLPSFPRSFHRDNAVSAFLKNDPRMHHNSLVFAAAIQGVKKDPKTGEQPGAIYHEFDTNLKGGVELLQSPGFTTFFNASDTTALFLLGHKEYFEITGDSTLFEKQQKNIQAAASYIVNHLNDNFEFVEDPKFADASCYALKVTSWKDSILYGRKDGIPSYPVVYPLVHIQNMAGLRAAAKLLGSKELLELSLEMGKAADKLVDKDIGNFPIAIDSDGIVKVLSTDGLHSLFYLEPGEFDREKILSIVDSSRALETRLGYRIMEKKAAMLMKNDYHAKTIWTHEQAVIHKGAGLHFKHAAGKGDRKLAKKLLHVMDVSSRVYKNFLKDNTGKNPEIFKITEEGIVPGGNDPQLWAIATRDYFKALGKSSN
jgi:glycogen debranching enzyme